MTAHGTDVSRQLGNNGTLVNSPTFVPGVWGQAINLNGSSYVSVPYSNSFSVNTWTASAWINLSANAAANLNGIIGTRFGGR